MDAAILSLLKQMGKPLTLKKRVYGEYDPDTGRPEATETSYTVQGAIIDNRDYMHGPQLGDRKALLAGKDIKAVPALDDQIVEGDFSYNIVDVHKISKGTEVVAYVCQVKR